MRLSVGPLVSHLDAAPCRVLEWSSCEQDEPVEADDLSVGIDSIDEQHKKLVNMINALNDALAKGEANDVMVKIFDGLVAYVDKHFTFEEALFTKAGWDGAAAHKEKHKQLVEEVMAFKASLDSGSGMIGIKLMKFLKEWLTNHIMKSDKEYADAVKAKGLN
ncbi:MAG: bacteriohemerythrin [Myxococcota bacterium]|nr:bacteriohemerythrin [Myxococcota bacterium]